METDTEMKKRDPLEVLLGGDLPDLRKETPRQSVEMPRLSQAAGGPVVFDLRGLTYREVRAIQEQRADTTARMVLAGCVRPDFKDSRLLCPDKGLATPLDVIKSKLLPGEIDELAVRIQQLSGYLRDTTAEVKNA